MTALIELPKFLFFFFFFRTLHDDIDAINLAETAHLFTERFWYVN